MIIKVLEILESFEILNSKNSWNSIRSLSLKILTNIDTSGRLWKKLQISKIIPAHKKIPQSPAFEL